MGQIIFETFVYFSDIPYNIWPWLFFLIIPALIFSAKPHHSVRLRFGRIFLAIIIGYVLINLTLHTSRAQDWRAYEECEKHTNNPRVNDVCGHLVNIADDASNVFYLVLGWIPAAAYAGFWELLWRRKYRSIIGPLGKTYEGKWFSTWLIICSIPILLIMLLILSLYIYSRIDCPPLIIARGKCWIRH